MLPHFVLAGSASTNPVLYTLAILLIIAGVNAGYYGLDRFLAPWLGRRCRAAGAGGLPPPPPHLHQMMFVYDGGWHPVPEEDSLLLKAAGLNVTHHSGAFTGPWIFPDNSPLRLTFDPGLAAGDRLRIPGYPPLQSSHYPITLRSPGAERLVFTRTPAGEEVPVITLRRFAGNGTIMFVNAPIGRLKAEANDDFMARGCQNNRYQAGGDRPPPACRASAEQGSGDHRRRPDGPH